MLGWSLACSLEFSLSPFNLHSVLSCDQKAGQEQRPPKDTLYPSHWGLAKSGLTESVLPVLCLVWVWA